MEQNIPKKRGRKPKIKDNDANKQFASSIMANKVPILSKAEERSKTDKNTKQAKRLLKINKYEEKIKLFEQQVLSKKMFGNIRDKFMTFRYANYKMREAIHDKIYKNIIENQACESEKKEWSTITYNAAEKLCAIINHLLSSGPLTESEVDLLDRSIFLLKSYYISRSKTLIENEKLRNSFYKMTYIPGPETYAYKIFIGEMVDIPSNTFIFCN